MPCLSKQSDFNVFIGEKQVKESTVAVAVQMTDHVKTGIVRHGPVPGHMKIWHPRFRRNGHRRAKMAEDAPDHQTLEVVWANGGQWQLAVQSTDTI